MTPYKRNLRLKLITVRLIFISFVTATIFLVNSDLADYAYILMILLVFGSIFPVSDLYIDNNTIIVKQYFIYGLVRHTTIFTKEDNVLMNDFEIEIANAGTWADLETDALTSPLIEKKYMLQSQDISGNVKKVKLKLSGEECFLIKESFIDKTQPIT